MNCQTRPGAAPEVEWIAAVPSEERANAKCDSFQLETVEDFRFGLEQVLESVERDREENLEKTIRGDVRTS